MIDIQYMVHPLFLAKKSHGSFRITFCSAVPSSSHGRISGSFYYVGVGRRGTLSQHSMAPTKKGTRWFHLKMTLLSPHACLLALLCSMVVVSVVGRGKQYRWNGRKGEGGGEMEKGLFSQETKEEDVISDTLSNSFINLFWWLPHVFSSLFLDLFPLGKKFWNAVSVNELYQGVENKTWKKKEEGEKGEKKFWLFCLLGKVAERDFAERLLPVLHKLPLYIKQ